MGISKIQHFPYALSPLAEPNRLSSARPRSGSLLKVTFDDLACAGHADLFSWPELGDKTLRELLTSLTSTTPLPQAAAALAWARLEAEACAQKKSLFSEAPIASHLTLTTLPAGVIDAGTAKLKITAEHVKNWSAVEAALLLSPETLWRFDFNGLFTTRQMAQEFWQKVSEELRARIDFLEDPFCAELMSDPRALAVFDGTDVAADRGPRDHAQVWVMKPVYSSPESCRLEARNFPGKIVVTSNMDHPLGQLTALAAAQMLASDGELLKCGLLTHNLYEEHPQSDWVMQREDCLWSRGQGPGWGLTAELSALDWREL